MSIARFIPTLLPLLMQGTLRAENSSWDARLAGLLSGRLSEIEKELQGIEESLPGLPDVPLADQGGTGGFAIGHRTAEPEEGNTFAFEVLMKESHAVDLIALVPARRYEVGGLEAQFGMPDSFSVDLLDEDGEVIERIADEGGLWSDPVRAGHPFMFEVSPPVVARGMRISARKLRLDPYVTERFVHAWSEMFMFEGERVLTRDASVSNSGGISLQAPWRWNEPFLVDDQTPLGLPEIIDGEHRDIGWISNGRKNAAESAWLELDLGEVQSFDGVRLIPAARPTEALPSGFGFPQELAVSVGDRPSGRGGAAPRLKTKVELSNPGNNPVFLPFERSKGRYVKIEALELWKAFEDYPAFFALSEVEVMDGERNLALGASVSSPDGMGNVIAPGSKYWSALSLTDGFGPDGRLVSHRVWLEQLDRRLALEQQAYGLNQESLSIIDGWRRIGLTSFALLGGAGAFMAVALPIRYRRKEKMKLTEVRERIASDLHDEVGSNLGSIQMFADLAEGRSGESDELKRIQRIAAETVSAVRDIVWLLQPSGDHRIGSAEHLRETSSIMLEPLEWEFTANEEAWQVELSDEANRHLFLFFREALHNVLRHASAKKVGVRVEVDAREFRLRVVDDGVGIDPERMKRRATLRALRKRVQALGAEFEVESNPGEGTSLDLRIPLDRRLVKSS